MLYHILKPIVRLARVIFCRRIIINKPEFLKAKGPLLLACNHPNSFLDSVIIDILFKRTVWSLARGDAFVNPMVSKIFHSLKILPVYRSSEGVENLSENYKTFEACIDIFRANGLVQIFSEGKCINEWHLRPLKKGTARLAIKAWEEHIPLKVLPVGINFSSFRRFGKNIFLHFGEPITMSDINLQDPEGLRHLTFNKKLDKQLSQLVFEIPKHDLAKQQKQLSVRVSVARRIILALPAVLGWLLHFPLYLPVKKFVLRKTNDNDHFDSIMTGILVFTYPVYLLLVTFLLYLLTQSPWVLLTWLVAPFTAWTYVQLKTQLDR